MPQQNTELPFFDCGVDESEHLISGGAHRPSDTWSSADRAVPAFPRPTAYSGPPTAPGFVPAAGAYPVYASGINAVSDTFGRISPASASPYSSGDSPAVSAHSSLPTFEYAPQQHAPNPFMGSYPIQDGVSSTMNFYPWVNTGVSTLGDTVMFDADPITLASPVPGLSLMTATSESVFTDSSRPNVGEFNSPAELVPSPQSPSDDSPRTKYSKVSFEQDLGGAQKPSRALAAAEAVSRPGNSGGGGEHGKSKLRSASRSSKNSSQRAGETADQRKTRNAHNLVEKQYRNRLNAQFEGLLNALPESIRSPSNAGVGGPSDSDPSIDLGERRLSKGDVLEMSTRYIKTLERDCNKLKRERDEFARTIDRLQAMIGAQSSMQEEPFSGG